VSRARDVVEVIVGALVDRPDELRVTERDHHGVDVVTVEVAPGDLGRIIGRQGRTAAAIRTLAAVTAEGDGRRVKVDILEPDER
jgi:predicted RNA-binding protein YlqC (UPF0109 family)